MSDADLTAALNLFASLGDWMVAVRTEATQRALDGKTFPGYRLSVNETRPKWRSVQQVFTCCEEEGLTKDDYAPRELLTPAQMRDLWDARRINRNVYTFTTSNEAGAVVVPENARNVRMTVAQVRARLSGDDLL